MMNINTANHKFLKPLMNKDYISVDATAGNGNDTLFLCRNSKFVYAFDIQEQAETNTRKRLERENFDNYSFILDNHANMNKYLEHADVILFNLGFLPNSDNELITETDNTIRALKIAYDLLNSKGYLSIACYLKHEGGYSEYQATQKWIDKNKLNVIYQYTNTERENSPVLFVIRKGD